MADNIITISDEEQDNDPKEIFRHSPISRINEQDDHSCSIRFAHIDIIGNLQNSGLSATIMKELIYSLENRNISSKVNERADSINEECSGILQFRCYIKEGNQLSPEFAQIIFLSPPSLWKFCHWSQNIQSYPNYSAANSKILEFIKARNGCFLITMGLDRFVSSKTKNQKKLLHSQFVNELVAFDERSTQKTNEEANLICRKKPRSRKDLNDDSIEFSTKEDFHNVLDVVQLKLGISLFEATDVGRLADLLTAACKSLLKKIQKSRISVNENTQNSEALKSAVENVKISLQQKRSMKIDGQSGEGVESAWFSFLLNFKNMGKDTALSLCRQFPTPRSLIDHFQKMSSSFDTEYHCKSLSIQCDNEKYRVEKEKFMIECLQGTLVTRGSGILSSDATLGKELSRQLFVYFHTQIPEEIIG